jgi:hypothetical protein
LSFAQTCSTIIVLPFPDRPVIKTGKNNLDIKIDFKSVKCPNGTYSLPASGITVMSFIRTLTAPVDVGPSGNSTTLF